MISALSYLHATCINEQGQQELNKWMSSNSYFVLFIDTGHMLISSQSKDDERSVWWWFIHIY